MSESTHEDQPPAHEADDAGHGQDGLDEPAQHAEKLGPIDWAAWGAGILGIAAGLVVAACLYLSVGGI